MAEDMTQAVWDSLPEQYKRADAEQSPTPYPLLRWLAGPGSIMTEVRDYADQAEDGLLTNAKTVPEKILPWLARMLGIDPSPNTSAETRTAILSRASGSAPYIGTRKHIGDAAARVLGANAPLGVYPHPTQPWVIVVASDVESIANAGGLEEVWKKLTRLSVAPAGFYIVPMEARVTWDQFDNAKPPTWAEFDAAIRTWNQFDSVGVSFD